MKAADERVAEPGPMNKCQHKMSFFTIYLLSLQRALDLSRRSDLRRSEWS